LLAADKKDRFRGSIAPGLLIVVHPALLAAIPAYYNGVRRSVSRVRFDNFYCAASLARAGTIVLWSEAFNQRSNG
jgi:hypothetical protein